jgi:Asp-tRNA(Asn)/Glu-tRNA(Gln) amidotransferase A subunit family amidase
MSLLTDRRVFLSCLSSLGFGATLLPGVLWAKVQEAKPQAISKDMLSAAAAVAGLTFTDQQLDKMLQDMQETLGRYERIRGIALDNSVAPPLYFNPIVPGMEIDRTRQPVKYSSRTPKGLPGRLEDLAFWSVGDLAELVRTKRVTSVELTEMYLGRIARLNLKLNCVVTVTEALAMAQAKEADREIAAGRYRGPLHGIPYGVKDLCAAKGYPTTWGAAPFKNRIIDVDATVVSRLRDAGAVLIAKLTTGELALDDVWFGGQTKNPWDLSMGSQGSSAGPASATAGGLVAFSIGTETGGSIVEPSGICGVTGLRPTYGRVSRHGAMALSWSLDKIGPMCRSVEDCAIVLSAIQGLDGQDLSVVDMPFNWNADLDVRRLRVGHLKAAFSNTGQTGQVDRNDAAALDALRKLGITLVEVALPDNVVVDLVTVLYGEANAALHDPIETEPAGLARQDRVGHHNAARLLPATEYVNANRVRALLMREMARVMKDIDVYVVPFDYADYTPNPVATLNTSLTNLTGQPCIVVPHGFNEKGNPTSLTFVGQLFGEARMGALARAYQEATGWHLQHPAQMA